jgi:hypothetical protein
MAVATRTGDKPAQAFGVCRRDPEIELITASGVLAACAKYHARSLIPPDLRCVQIGACNFHQFQAVTPYKLGFLETALKLTCFAEGFRFTGRERKLTTDVRIERTTAGQAARAATPLQKCGWA